MMPAIFVAASSALVGEFRDQGVRDYAVGFRGFKGLDYTGLGAGVGDQGSEFTRLRLQGSEFRLYGLGFSA